jgi:uncharacterized protein YciI
MTAYFAVFATDRPGAARLRAEIRETHRRYLRAPEGHDVLVRLGGPTLEESTGAMNGTLLVVEAADIDAVRAFVADDPYSRAGLFAAVEIRPWRWGLGNPDAAP